jgi:hypothetical protein
VRNVSFGRTGLRSFASNDASKFVRLGLAVLAGFVLLADSAQAAGADVPTTVSIAAGGGRPQIARARALSLSNHDGSSTKVANLADVAHDASSVSKALPCASTSIASVRAPSGPAAYQHGTLRLKNGASVWIEGSSTDAGVIQAVHMEPGDAVAACYGPAHRYADAGEARAITVLDLVTSGSYGNVVGSWPGAK